MLKGNTRFWGVLCSVGMGCALIFVSGCGGSSSTTTAAAADTTVSKAVPSDVVVSSPTATVAASASISKSEKVAGEAPAVEDFVTKKNELKALIAGTGECSFTLALNAPDNPSCYGPQINYSGHPGGGSGSLPILDTGLWNETQGTEACAAAKMNSLIGNVAGRVDNLINIFGAMSCAGKKAGIELPAAGSSVDLKAAMTSNVTVGGLTVSSATLERLADDADGKSVYRSTLGMSLDFGGGTTGTGTIILKHIPLADDNSTYKGKLSVSMSSDHIQGCGSGGDFSPEGGIGVTAGTVLYSKASASAVVYEVNYANFCGSDPFDDSNNVLPSNKYNQASNPNGWVHDWNYGLFSIDPSNGMGTVAYSWQAGQGDQRSRVLNVTVDDAADGSASGVAYYGYGPDVASDGLGTIDGFICNWAGPGGAIQAPGDNRSQTALKAINPPRAVDKAQKQTLTRAVGATEFTATAEGSLIRYAVSNSCTATANDNFLYQAVNNVAPNAALNFSNDRTDDPTDIASELVDLSDITSNFTAPTPPSDI